MMEPRPHQRDGAAAALAAHRAGRSGFLLGDDVGLGKTLTACLVAAELPHDEVLIVCPRGAIPHWQRTVQASPLRAKRVKIINHERLRSLLTLRPEALAPGKAMPRTVKARNRAVARKGTIGRTYPILIVDEAHKLRNPLSQMTLSASKLVEGAAFTLYLSATAGQNPIELSYLRRLIGDATGTPMPEVADFRKWAQANKLGRTRGRYTNWRWERDERDLAYLSGILYEREHPIGIRRRPADIAGWPEIQRIVDRHVLNKSRRALYEASWRDFRRELDMEGRRGNPMSRRAALLRQRQKTSLLRIETTLDVAEELLDNNLQVAISCEFLETMTTLRQSFADRGIACARIDGLQSVGVNEAERLNFQTGVTPAVVFTVSEAISLHQGEHNDRERALIVHDLRWSAIRMMQIEGRCHRDGRRAMIHYQVAEDTVDEAILEQVLARMATMASLQGDPGDIEDAILTILHDAGIEHALGLPQ
jgi:hypothetical protein